MNENMNTNTADEVKSAFCTLAEKVKKCNGKLPRIEYFRVDIDKGTGTADNWHATGYLLMVKVQGIDGMYAAGSVGAAYGMNIKSKYKTEDDARKAGFEMKKTWGRNVVSVKSEKSAKSLAEKLQAKVGELSKEQRDQLMSILMAA